jgi:hypothetical protein
MTAKATNPSLRWFAAYLAAAVAGTLVSAIGTALVVSGPGQGSVIGLWATRVLPFALAILFVPIALLTFLLHKAGRWTLPAFTIAGAALPAIFFALLFAMSSGSTGDNFLPLLLIWSVSGAVGGAAFFLIWARLT